MRGGIRTALGEKRKARRHGGGLNSEQAKKAARKRWDARPVRMCEVCGREHRCWQVVVGSAEEVEGAIATMTELFGKSVRGTVVVKEEKDDEGEGVGRTV